MSQDIDELRELLPRVWELADQVRERMVRITDGQKLFRDFDAKQAGISELVKKAREVVEFVDGLGHD